MGASQSHHTGALTKPLKRGDFVNPLGIHTHMSTFSPFYTDIEMAHKVPIQRGFTEPLNMGALFRDIHIQGTFQSFLLQIWGCYAKSLADSRGFYEAPLTQGTWWNPFYPFLCWEFHEMSWSERKSNVCKTSVQGVEVNFQKNIICLELCEMSRSSQKSHVCNANSPGAWMGGLG